MSLSWTQYIFGGHFNKLVSKLVVNKLVSTADRQDLVSLLNVAFVSTFIIQNMCFLLFRVVII